MSHLDPRSAHCDSEVRRIIDLQSLAQNMPDAFSDLVKVTRSHIPAANVPARIDVPEGRTVPEGRAVPEERSTAMAANQSYLPAQKRRRPLGSKDSYPRKQIDLAQTNPLAIAISIDPSHEIIPDYGSVLEETTLGDTPTSELTPENREISVSHACISEVWKQNEIIIDNTFVFMVATEIILSDDVEPTLLMNANVETTGQNGNKQSKSN